MARNSGAWMVAIVAIIAYIMGVLLLTAVDPVLQALFDSTLWSASTADGQAALNWQQRSWAIFPVAILVAILFEIFIVTRQPQ
jgi:uncharacterized integral membrane protein